MSQNIDLKTLEKKAWQSVFQDGLWDIYLGILLMAFAVSAWLDTLAMEDGLRMGIYIGVMVFAMLVLAVGKRFITIPRMGQVRFGEKRKRMRNYTRLVLLFSVVVGLIMYWISASVYAGDIKGILSSKWLLPLVWVLNIGIVTGLAAYFMEYDRLYIIGFLYAVTVPLDFVIKTVIRVDIGMYIFLVAGLIILVMGSIYLIRFVREYKSLDLHQG